MTPRMHECIALGPTGNLQGSVKFYCLTTGRVLKRRLFTPMPMPDRVIKQVDTIGEREGQGRTFHFLNQCKEPYKWTDSVPEEDPEFQGLLENDDEALYPDISAELPGVALEIEERDFTLVTDKPEEDFCDLAGAALHNAGIDADQRIHAALDANNKHQAPAIIEVDNDETLYKVTFVFPDAGLPIANDHDANLGNQHDNTIVPAIVADDTNAQNPPSRYRARARRSVIESQPYNAFAPRVALLQLGMTQVHRSVLKAAQLLQMSKEENMFATTASSAVPTVDETIHRYDKIMTTTSEEELHAWAYYDSIQS